MGAFGSGGTSGNDVQIKVTVEAEQAKRAITDLSKQFSGIADQAAKSGKILDGSISKLAESIRNPIGAVSDLSKKFVETNARATLVAGSLSSIASKAGPVAIAIGGVTLALGGANLALNKLISLAAEGNDFGDIADAFRDNADQAGVLADVLQNRLSAAYGQALDNAQLLATANKLFAQGFDPGTFDEIAAAAKRYANATGGDAVQATEQLARALLTGNENLAKKFGTIQGGNLVLREFTDAEQRAADAAKNVTEAAKRYAAASANLSLELKRALDESELLRIVTEAVKGAILAVKGAIVGAITAFIEFTNKAIRVARAELEQLSDGFAILGQILRQLKNREMPSFGKAVEEVSRQKLAKLQTEGAKAGNVLIKLGQDGESSASKINKAGDAAEKLAEELRKISNDADVQINELFGRFTPTQFTIIDEVRKAFEDAGNNGSDVIQSVLALKDKILEGISDPEDARKAAQFLVETFRKELDKAQSGGTGDSLADSLIRKLRAGVSQEDILGQLFSDNPNGFSAQAAGADFAAIFASGLEGGLIAALARVGEIISQQIAKAILDGFDSSDVGPAVNQISQSLFGSITGPILGAVLEKTISSALEDSAATKARKAADKFFADIFDANRLSIIVGNEVKQIKDLVFQGDTLFGGENLEFGAKGANNPFSFLSTLPGEAQVAFAGVGAAFEQLLGVSEDIGGQLAAVFANNIGGELLNLQALVEQTGKSFEELGNAILQAFKKGELSIQETQNALVGLRDVLEVGIPGAVGAVDQAIDKFRTALKADNPGQILFNSLRGVGGEAKELGITYEELVQRLVRAFGLGADKITLFFQALKQSGINSIEELINAGEEKLISFAANVQQILAGGAPTNAAVTPPENEVGTQKNFASPVPISRGSSASSGRSAAQSKAEQERDRRKREREQLLQEVRRLTVASADYKRILDQLNSGQLDNREAGRQLSNLYDDTRRKVEELKRAQNAYNKELAKAKPNFGVLGNLAQEIERLQAALNGKSGGTEGKKPFNPELLQPFLNDANALGIAMRELGISAEDAGKSIINSFKAGKLGVNEAAAELRKLKDIAEGGIPGVTGDVTGAFRNILRGGENGGAFSLDALRDLAIEAQEQFLEKSAPDRLAEFQRLTKEFDKARAAFDSAVNSGATNEEVQALKGNFDFARKALQDFSATVPQAGIQDLRASLLSAFDPRIVNSFFGALDSAGIASLTDLENASDDTKINILANFDSTSDALKQTADDIAIINQQLNELRKGVDIELRFTSSTFDALVQAIIDKFGFGDKVNVAETTPTVTPPTGGSPGLSSAEQREFTRLSNLRKKGRLSPADRRRFEQLRRIANTAGAAA